MTEFNEEDMEFMVTEDAESNSQDDFNDILYGSLCFVGLAFIMSLILPLYVGYRTSDESMSKTNMSMACGLSWLVVLYMWIGWVTYYQSKVQHYIAILPKLLTSAG